MSFWLFLFLQHPSIFMVNRQMNNLITIDSFVSGSNVSVSSDPSPPLYPALHPLSHLLITAWDQTTSSSLLMLRMSAHRSNVYWRNHCLKLALICLFHDCLQCVCMRAFVLVVFVYQAWKTRLCTHINSDPETVQIIVWRPFTMLFFAHRELRKHGRQGVDGWMDRWKVEQTRTKQPADKWCQEKAGGRRVQKAAGKVWKIPKENKWLPTELWGQHAEQERRQNDSIYMKI